MHLQPPHNVGSTHDPNKTSWQWGDPFLQPPQYLIEQCAPLQLGMHPICSASNLGPQSLRASFTNPPSCAGAAFLCPIKLPKVWGQHPMHHSASKEGGEEGSVSWQLLVDRSASVICKKHQEFLIIRPRLVDQPKASAFYQELGHLVRCPLQSNDDCGFYNYF